MAISADAQLISPVGPVDLLASVPFGEAAKIPHQSARLREQVLLGGAIVVVVVARRAFWPGRRGTSTCGAPSHPINRTPRMRETREMAARVSVGLCAFVGLLTGCVSERQAALSPSTPPTAGGSTTPTREWPRTSALLKEVCGGFVRVCVKLGADFETGSNRFAKDEHRAATLYEAACSGGSAEGCYNLGVLYANGNGVAKDKHRAVTLFKQACRAGMVDPLCQGE